MLKHGTHTHRAMPDTEVQHKCLLLPGEAVPLSTDRSWGAVELNAETESVPLCRGSQSSKCWHGLPATALACRDSLDRFLVGSVSTKCPHCQEVLQIQQFLLFTQGTALDEPLSFILCISVYFLSLWGEQCGHFLSASIMAPVGRKNFTGAHDFLSEAVY